MNKKGGKRIKETKADAAHLRNLSIRKRKHVTGKNVVELLQDPVHLDSRSHRGDLAGALRALLGLG